MSGKFGVSGPSELAGDEFRVFRGESESEQSPSMYEGRKRARRSPSKMQWRGWRMSSLEAMTGWRGKKTTYATSQTGLFVVGSR